MNYTVCRRCFLDWTMKHIGESTPMDGYYEEQAKKQFREKWIEGCCLCHENNCNIPSDTTKKIPENCPYYLEHLVGKDT
jgi:cytochrome c553